MKKKYTETLKPGFYLIENERCFYITGTLKGNKWINLSCNDKKWLSLIWNCVDTYEINLSTYYPNNPTNFIL